MMRKKSGSGVPGRFFCGQASGSHRLRRPPFVIMRAMMYGRCSDGAASDGLFGGFCGGFWQGVSGFAFAMVVVSLLSLFIHDYLVVLAMACMMGLAVTGMESVRLRHEIRWAILPIPSLAFIVCDIIALHLVKHLPEVRWFLILGVMLIALSLFMAFFQKRLHVEPTPRNGLIAGALAGFGGGLFTVSGPPAVVYLLAVLGDDKMGYISTIQAFSVIMLGFDLSMRLLLHVVPVATLPLLPAGLLATATGLWLGKRVLKRISVEAMRWSIYGLMLLNGIFLMLK